MLRGIQAESTTAVILFPCVYGASVPYNTALPDSGVTVEGGRFSRENPVTRCAHVRLEVRCTRDVPGMSYPSLPWARHHINKLAPCDVFSPFYIITFTFHLVVGDSTLAGLLDKPWEQLPCRPFTPPVGALLLIAHKVHSAFPLLVEFPPVLLTHVFGLSADRFLCEKASLRVCTR